jgi:dipeptidyl aminopeptidase/acylaminoacyl peptidase
VYVARDEQANIFRLGFDPVTESVTGVPTAVTKGTKLFISPNPSPDNEWVAFRSAGTQEDIYISRKDGSGLRQLTNDIYKDRGPSWSPDGKKITFYAARSGRYEIWSINPDGSGLEQMTKTIGGSPNYPFWFSDGKRIACSNSGEEGTMLFDLSKPLNERLVEVLPPASNDGKKFYVNSVSPNSEWLAGDILRSDGNPIPGVALYSMSNKTYQTITDSGNVPLWLNDNLRLLYQKNGKLFIVNYRTKKSHEVKTPESFFLVGDYRISNDNRVVYYQVFSSESDIWQVTMK